MSEFKFTCPSCGQHLAAPEASMGQQIQCPACQGDIVIPAPPAETTESAAQNPASRPGLRIAGVDKTTPPPSSASSGAQANSFCPNCGKPIAPGAAFCGACGNPTGQGSTGAGRRPATSPPEMSGLPENIAGGLCYVGFLITGIIFLIIDRRPFVRFHAAQAVVACAGLYVLRFIVGMVIGFAVSSHIQASIQANPRQPPDMSWLNGLGHVYSAFWLVGLILWILCLVSAFRGERFHLPIAGDIAESIANKR
jgi:uncharacterized membrane protein